MLDQSPQAVLEAHARRASDAANDPETRAVIAADLSAVITEETLSEAERRIAIDIVSVLAQDVVEQVREALAEHIKHCPFLPSGIAKTLAEDIETVAIPIIECSSALSDEDLLEIVAGGSEAKQVAVARRPEVSAPVANALAETQREAVVRTMLENKGVDLDEGTFHRLVKDYEANPQILELVASRDELPLTVTERLISQVSLTLRKRLIEKHELPAEMVDQMADLGQERSLVAWLKRVHNTVAVEQLVAHLKERNSLSPTLILRALCEGDLHFFEAAIATLADIPIDNARRLIDDPGQRGLKRLYQSSGLPSHLYRAFRATLEIIREHRARPLAPPINETIRDIIARLVVEYRDLCPADLESTLSMLSRRADMARENPFEMAHSLATVAPPGEQPTQQLPAKTS